MATQLEPRNEHLQRPRGDETEVAPPLPGQPTEVSPDASGAEALVQVKLLQPELPILQREFQGALSPSAFAWQNRWGDANATLQIGGDIPAPTDMDEQFSFLNADFVTSREVGDPQLKRAVRFAGMDA